MGDLTSVPTKHQVTRFLQAFTEYRARVNTATHHPGRPPRQSRLPDPGAPPARCQPRPATIHPQPVLSTTAITSFRSAAADRYPATLPQTRGSDWRLRGT
ncbi:hypothetical protein E2C01_054601 [Portunus trituberculatus]|uniref:Uncharacterized protein n=1 Tax=Portunus trituberculatus TaxID=210409 RepID=A0A5B7GP39_PORTR|nr:hypothetical protein [Portunus trituberculatus]